MNQIGIAFQMFLSFQNLFHYDNEVTITTPQLIIFQKNIAGKGDSICNKRLYTFPIENNSSKVLHMKQYSIVYRKASSFSVLEDRSIKQGPY